MPDRGELRRPLADAERTWAHLRKRDGGNQRAIKPLAQPRTSLSTADKADPKVLMDLGVEP
jgi:hypothetical protein